MLQFAIVPLSTRGTRYSKSTWHRLLLQAMTITRTFVYIYICVYTQFTTLLLLIICLHDKTKWVLHCRWLANCAPKVARPSSLSCVMHHQTMSRLLQNPVLQLDQVHLGEIWRTPSIHHSSIPVQARKLIANPDVLRKLLRPENLIVTHT